MIRKSIAWKYLIAMFVMIVIPILTMGGYVYGNYKQILLTNSSGRTLQVLDQTALSIDNYTRSMSLTLAAIGNDPEFLTMLNRWHEGDMYERYTASRKLDLYLKRITGYLTDVNVVAVFAQGEAMYDYGKPPLPTADEIRHASWYADAMENRHKVKIIDSFASLASSASDKCYVSAAIHPQPFAGNTAVEMIYLSAATNLLDIFEASPMEYQASDLFILDDQNRLIFSRQKNPIDPVAYDFAYDPGTTVQTISGEEYMIASSAVDKPGWTLFCLTRVKDAVAELNTISKSAVIALVLVLCLFSAFSIYFLRSIVLPIKKLIHLMKQVERGNFDISIEDKKHDELHLLESAFNQMVGRIQHLIDESNQQEKKKNEAEMEALQSQINPHFIANTLSTIRFMAMIAKADNIKEMSESFINIVTSSFNRESRYHTIEMEINVLQSYIHIMQIRTGKQFSVSFEAEDQVKGFYLLKMLVQPIVENAILHGLSDMTSDEGRIKVTFARLNDDLLVEVEDNGVGIEEDRIQKLLNEDFQNRRGFTGMGIKNIDQRIKLNHGEKYGMTIESVVGQYTLFSLRLPIIREAADQHQQDVQPNT